MLFLFCQEKCQKLSSAPSFQSLLQKTSSHKSFYDQRSNIVTTLSNITFIIHKTVQWVFGLIIFFVVVSWNYNIKIVSNNWGVFVCDWQLSFTKKGISMFWKKLTTIVYVTGKIWEIKSGLWYKSFVQQLLNSSPTGMVKFTWVYFS